METHVNNASTKSPENRGVGGAPRGNRNAVRHGTYSRVAVLKRRKWDRRTREWRAITARERELCKALGPSMSPQKAALVREVATLEAVLLSPLDVYLAGAKIVKRGGKVDGAVELRLRLSGRLQDLLTAVGLDKVKRQARPLWQRQPKRRKNQDEDRSEGKEIPEGCEGRA